MKCLIIFNGINDVIFSKYDTEFKNHINKLAKLHGLIKDEEVFSSNDGGYGKISLNIIVQIFSPLITSHRVMNCEFRNTYNSIECQDGIKLVFEEYIGYLIVAIGNNEISNLKTWQKMCIAFVKTVCCVNIDLLRNDIYLSSLVDSLLDSWENISNIDQACKLEAVEQLIVNSDMSSVTLQILKEIVEKFPLRKLHAFITVQNKFLSLYSSQNAKELSTPDILFLIILNNIKNSHSPSLSTKNDDDDDLLVSKNNNNNSSSSSLEEEIETNLENWKSYYLFLTDGYKAESSCVPHVVHCYSISEQIRLLIVIESTQIAPLSIAIYETFWHFNVMQKLQNQRVDFDTIKFGLENLDVAVYKLISKLKLYSTSSKIKTVINSKLVNNKWKYTKKIYEEMFRGDSDESSSAVMKSELALHNFGEFLKKSFDLITCDNSLVNFTRKLIKDSLYNACEKFVPYVEIFQVKAMKNFSLGSYLEDFPGLVHFIYIDRNSNRIIAPNLDVCFDDETNKQFKREVWQMIEYCQLHLRKGHLSLMWKNSTFTFAYFLWFEDSTTTGEPIKPLIEPSQAVKKINNIDYVIFNGDFYNKLKENCFPKTSSPRNKIQCYELYSVHLKIAAPALILEQMRKLTSSVWEMKGFNQRHPIDLL